MNLIVKIMECLSINNPILLMIEDLHWCDSESFAVLLQLRQFKRILIVASSRPVERNGTLDDLHDALRSHEQWIVSIELAPMADSDILELATVIEKMWGAEAC